ncbi:hypothetical protein M011DRAFT_89967 [Sporormia fimetaria CBS 119925]|uniref:Uncharacterized protein n=1 Tax=Sporormia fimetaria CBS 119925 TaxID=1340428 RepID=A0A6A6V6D4_9PLEO|nr:hypothetical protein M011DRAFT_89967 [Sporormia fimetaria CBS 119925]
MTAQHNGYICGRPERENRQLFFRSLRKAMVLDRCLLYRVSKSRSLEPWSAIQQQMFSIDLDGCRQEGGEGCGNRSSDIWNLFWIICSVEMRACRSFSGALVLHCVQHTPISATGSMISVIALFMTFLEMCSTVKERPRKHVNTTWSELGVDKQGQMCLSDTSMCDVFQRPLSVGQVTSQPCSVVQTDQLPRLCLTPSPRRMGMSNCMNCTTTRDAA